MGQTSRPECWDGELSALQEGHTGQARWKCCAVREGEFALYGLVTGDIAVESLWVGIKGMDSNAGVVVGVCY